MAKFRFHKLAALIVLGTATAWVLTGEFTSVGSLASEAEPPKTTIQSSEKSDPKLDKDLRTVSFIEPIFVNHAQTVKISGATKANKRTQLATRASGIIDKLYVSRGDVVEAGTPILALEGDDRIAAVENAKAQLDQAEKRYSASQKLAKAGNLAKLKLDADNAALVSARTQLDRAQADIDRLQVKAPFSGIIDDVMVEQGSSVSQGVGVAVLLQLDPILAVGEISETDLFHVKKGDSAEISLVSGPKLKGKIRYISREANPKTRTFPVEVEIDNDDHSIPMGMTAEINLQGKPRRVVMLPRSVIALSNEGDLGVRIIKPDDSVGFVPIEIVDDTPAGLFLGNIPQDVRIIVTGQALVNEGEKVNGVPADPKLIQSFIDSVKAADKAAN